MSSRFSCPTSFSGPPITSYVTVHVIVYNNAGVPVPVAGASVALAGPSGANYSGITNGAGAVQLDNVGAPAFFVTLSITAIGFDNYSNTFTIETLPVDITYVVGPPGTATGAQIQLPPLVTGGGPAVCNTTLGLAQPAGIPARPNLRWWRGNFCGHDVAGAGFVPGGSTARPDLVFTPFLDRYTAPTQAAILANFAAAGYTHFSLSWPDSRDGNGQTIAQFVATCQAVQAAGMYTHVMLTSKVYDAANLGAGIGGVIGGVVAALEAVGACNIYCVGWELNLFNDPLPLQAAIDATAALVVPVRPLYVHFSPGVIAWQPDGQFTNYFWNANVNKLTGVLHQRNAGESPDCPGFQNRLADTQVRFGGGFGFPGDSGFGHPFDCVTWEVSANEMFYGASEASGNAMGKNGIYSPVPNPGVPIMGYGNGCTGNP